MSATTEEVQFTSETPVGGAGDTQISRELLLVASVVVLGAVMSILDTTVVNVAINTLAARFHTTLPTIQWVATGYTLALADGDPADRLDRRPLGHEAPVHGLDRDVRARLVPVRPRLVVDARSSCSACCRASAAA